MSRRRLCRVGAGLAILAAMFGFSSVAYADEKPEYQLGITPAKHDFSVFEPGEIYTDGFKIRNSGSQEFQYKISFAPYTVNGEQYNPDTTTKTKYNEISDWIVVDDLSGTLASGEERVLNYKIEVPEDAHGGAQMGTIVVTMENKTESGEKTAVESVQQLGYIVYGNVNGDVIETGKVLENKVPSFLFNPPIIGTSLVENTGNVYTRASYKLQVFPLFSDEEAYTNEENPENNIIFPETKRYNEIRWEGAPQLGIFKVRQTVKIFDDESVTEKLVFLCPIWFLFIVILLIFLIIFWTVSRAVKRKREA